MMFLGLLQLGWPTGKIHMPKADLPSHQICLSSSPKMQASPCITSPSRARLSWPRLCLAQLHCPSLQCLLTAAAARKPWVKTRQVRRVGFLVEIQDSVYLKFSHLPADQIASVFLLVWCYRLPHFSLYPPTPIWILGCDRRKVGCYINIWPKSIFDLVLFGKMTEINPESESQDLSLDFGLACLISLILYLVTRHLSCIKHLY